jgi:hypothetical protein
MFDIASGQSRGRVPFGLLRESHGRQPRQPLGVGQLRELLKAPADGIGVPPPVLTMSADNGATEEDGRVNAVRAEYVKQSSVSGMTVVDGDDDTRASG